MFYFNIMLHLFQLNYLVHINDLENTDYECIYNALSLISIMFYFLNIEN